MDWSSFTLFFKKDKTTRNHARKLYPPEVCRFCCKNITDKQVASWIDLLENETKTKIGWRIDKKKMEYVLHAAGNLQAVRSAIDNLGYKLQRNHKPYTGLVFTIVGGPLASSSELPS